jgi:hypothetical protein
MRIALLELARTSNRLSGNDIFEGKSPLACHGSNSFHRSTVCHHIRGFTKTLLGLMSYSLRVSIERRALLFLVPEC